MDQDRGSKTLKWMSLLSAVGFAMVAQAAIAATAAGYKTAHRFDKSDGFAPYGELLQTSDGMLVGTVFGGGDQDGGVAFQLTTSGKFTPLHGFSTTDGAGAATGLVEATDGSLYGVTGGGGEFGFGTAYKVSKGGDFTLLHSFGGVGADGAYPYLGRLVQGADGNFYGVASQGGANGFGTVFRMSSGGQVKVLHAFAGGKKDGATPQGGLTVGSDGNLYGTTLCGGIAPAKKSKADAGCGGVLYKITTSGKFTIIHRFDAKDLPQAAPVQIGGTFYGVTTAGGANGFGQVWKFEPGAGNFSVLHSFAGGVNAVPANDDGARPVGRLLVASDGNLFGTTLNGGSNTATDPQGDGTIYRISTTGAYTLVHTFGASVDDAARPFAGLVQSKDGDLYGVTRDGGTNSNGVMFKLSLPAR